MIKNVFIFTLLQIYVRDKKYYLRRGGGGKNKIFNVMISAQMLCIDECCFASISKIILTFPI